MSPVNLCELDAVTRDLLAQKVISGFTVLEAKLTDFEADIKQLWVEFENLKAGETILGCKTKTEFCSVHLHRSRRAVNYMLSGGNPTSERETVSRPTDPNAKPTTWEPAKPVTEPEQPKPQPVIPTPKPDSPTPANPNAKPTKCPDCGEPFPSRNRLKEHGMHVHNIPSTDVGSFMRRADGKNEPAAVKPVTAPESKPERTIADVLDKLVERIVLQPYGYSAAKFKMYPQQHTVDLSLIDLRKLSVWERILEITQARIIAAKEHLGVQ